MTRATVAPAFFDRYPNATGQVSDLNPTDGRVDNAPEFKLRWEEFYNINVSCRPLTISPRDCQRPMYELLARRDDVNPHTGAPYIGSPESACFPVGLDRSSIDRAPVGIVISTYSDTKPVVGSEDFLWGFHPLAFEFEEIRRSLMWIMDDRWNLTVIR